MTKNKRPSAAANKPLLICPKLLRRWALPQPDEGGDKEERGRVLVVGGAPEMPGAVILAATAALRAGAGKLQIATCKSIAPFVAAAVPEAMVIALPETKSGAISAACAAEVAARAGQAHAVLIGPGMVDEAAVARFMENFLAQVESTSIVLDAAALLLLADAPDSLQALKGKAVLTPHAGELAGMTGVDKEEITKEPLPNLLAAVARFHAVVALKGRETHIAAPHSDTYCNRAGNVGLATSGSGDTLSGVIAGLAARGASPLQAAVWGVYLHARAGDVLAHRVGPLGFLARELLAEIPPLMARLAAGRS